jgi:hypothetical protein
LKCGTCCLILELQINVHLTNFPNLLIGNDLIELLFPYALLVFLEMVVLNTIEKIIGRGAKLLHSRGLGPTCPMENIKLFVLCNVVGM